MFVFVPVHQQCVCTLSSCFSSLEQKSKKNNFLMGGATKDQEPERLWGKPWKFSNNMEPFPPWR